MSESLSQLLQENFNLIKNTRLTELFKQDLNRVYKFSLNYSGLYFDFSKNLCDETTLKLLRAKLSELKISDKIKAMFNGEKINKTENRAVLHTLLRDLGAKEVWVDGHEVSQDVRRVRNKMQNFSNQVHSGEVRGFSGKKLTTIVNIGIGGSDLGPVLLSEALKPYRVPGMQIKFISSVDGYMALDVLQDLDPETTLFVIASKTFTTEETITNAKTARAWFLNQVQGDENKIAKHFIALSTNSQEVIKFGIDPNNMFEFWDFVGGRYSSYSAIGLSLALYIGFENFYQFLNGAYQMDEHFLNAAIEENIPITMALIAYWYQEYFKYNSLVISPYNTRLTRFPAYIQQLEMESNGKSVDLNGESINYPTCPVVWGDSAINAQHAYYQLLHQGTQVIPMDIIIALSDSFSLKAHNDILWANAIAQAEALMCGRSYAEALNEVEKRSNLDPKNAQYIARHKVFNGNRPSNMIILPEVNPYYMGMLLALYEHKVFVQGVLWNINSFDQMGVELGKLLAKTVLSDIKAKEVSKHDESTSTLIQYYLTNCK